MCTDICVYVHSVRNGIFLVIDVSLSLTEEQKWDASVSRVVGRDSLCLLSR